MKMTNEIQTNKHINEFILIKYTKCKKRPIYKPNFILIVMKNTALMVIFWKSRYLIVYKNVSFTALCLYQNKLNTKIIHYILKHKFLFKVCYSLEITDIFITILHLFEKYTG